MQAKILLIAVTLISGIYAANAQTISGEETQRIENAINEASKSIRTLQCGFTQEKTVSILETKMVSTGRMFYKEGKLCWEYIEPYSYRFVMNGDKVMMSNESGDNVIDVRGNRMFRKLSEIIIGGIDGTGITDTDSFDLTFSAGKDVVVVRMVPRLREMKSMFQAIELHFSTRDYMVGKIVLNEESGDNSVITLRDRILNQPIDEKVFYIP